MKCPADDKEKPIKHSFLFVHFSVHSGYRWGRTFPLARAVAAHGHAVTLLTSEKRGQKGMFARTEDLAGVHVVAFKDIVPEGLLVRGIGLVSFVARCLYCLCFKFDFVFSDAGELPNATWPCKIAQKLRGSYYISEWSDMLGKGGHFDRKPRWFKILFGWFYLWSILWVRKSADMVVVLSKPMRDHAIVSGIAPERIAIVPGGASCALFDGIQHAEAGASGGGMHPVVLGYIGMEDSEIEDLLPLIDVLRSSKYRGRFRFVSFGKLLSPDVIKRFQLGQIIEERGWVDYNKEAVKLAEIDIFVLMKTTNLVASAAGWPNKLGDYFATGRAVMATPYGDVREFMEDNPIGFIPISFEPAVIERELDAILKGDYDLERMGRFNRHVALEKISWEARCSTMCDLAITLSGIGRGER